MRRRSGLLLAAQGLYSSLACSMMKSTRLQWQ